MKSGVLSRADSICRSWIFLHLFFFFTALMHLPASSLHSASSSPPHFFSLFAALLFVSVVCNFPSACLSASSHSWISLCLGLWAGFWQGLLSLSLPQASKGKERDRLCHIMRALLPRLWLRVVIQNWCREEPVLTSCQQHMFSTSRQASRNDNVGYARWALTTPLKLWHTWYLIHCLQMSLRHINAFTYLLRVDFPHFFEVVLTERSRRSMLILRFLLVNYFVFGGLQLCWCNQNRIILLNPYWGS